MPRIRIFIIGVDDERSTSASLTPNNTPESYWQHTLSRLNPKNVFIAYEAAETLQLKPQTDQEFYNRAAEALMQGHTLGDVHQCVYELQAWAVRHGLNKIGNLCDAPTRETVVAGPRKPPRTVTVQQWLENPPADLSERAWAAMHEVTHLFNGRAK